MRAYLIRAVAQVSEVTDEIAFSSQFPEGTILAGKYEIQSLVGIGACGSVYKARHLATSKVVALKILPRTQESDTTSLSRFMQESRTLASLVHPNIVGVLGLELTDTFCLLAMEYVEGRTLAQYLKDEGPVSRERCVLIFSQVMRGLAYMHEKGVIHRDIKPENLVITESENDSPLRVRIVDFGLSKLLSQDQRITRAGAILGTPLYMSPEQCLGQDADCRSDIYAVGCVMFEAVTGSAPFQGETLFDTAHSHISQPLPVIPARGLGKIPGIIQRATSKLPEERFQSAADILRELNGDDNYSVGPTVNHSGSRESRAVIPLSRSSLRRLIITSVHVRKVAIATGLAVLSLGAFLTIRAEGVSHVARMPGMQEPIQVTVRKIEQVVIDRNSKIPEDEVLRLAEDISQQEACRGSQSDTGFRAYRAAHRALGLAFEGNGDKVRRNVEYLKAINLSHSKRRSDAFLTIELAGFLVNEHDVNAAKRILTNQIDWDNQHNFGATEQTSKVARILQELENNPDQSDLAALK